MAAMRILLIPVLVTVLVSGCSTPGMTRQDLVQRMGTSYVYGGSRFLYMGTKDGCDYVAHRWDDYRGRPGAREFRFRVGELPVGTAMDFTVDESRWREFSPWTK